MANLNKHNTVQYSTVVVNVSEIASAAGSGPKRMVIHRVANINTTVLYLLYVASSGVTHTVGS